MEQKKALIAMSGGVDSSVAAYLTREAGYACTGATMRLYDNSDIGAEIGSTCCSLDDVEDARAVATRLGMRHYVFNFTDDFHEKVIGNFIRCYECGTTPNPCIQCNRYLKFDHLLRRGLELGCDYVVTGHYARIRKDETTGRYLLYINLLNSSFVVNPNMKCEYSTAPLIVTLYEAFLFLGSPKYMAPPK